MIILLLVILVGAPTKTWWVSTICVYIYIYVYIYINIISRSRSLELFFYMSCGKPHPFHQIYWGGWFFRSSQIGRRGSLGTLRMWSATMVPWVPAVTLGHGLCFCWCSCRRALLGWWWWWCFHQGDGSMGLWVKDMGIYYWQKKCGYLWDQLRRIGISWVLVSKNWWFWKGTLKRGDPISKNYPN